MFTLNVSGIGKHYGETLLFKNISFQLNQGDVLGADGTDQAKAPCFGLLLAL
jgi:ABC-type phosphonate transport system ATPase subunit